MSMKITSALILAGAMALPVAPALANDTMAEIATGGLVFVRTDAVAIASEDLYISPDEVRVAYQFRNDTSEDVEAIVAFPMPNIANNPYGDVSLPEPGVDNFLSFTVEAGGKPISPALEQRAFSAELDVTAELKAAAVPVNPVSEAAVAAIRRLPEAKLLDWQVRGIVTKDPYEDPDAAGWLPAWTMKSTYWWKMKFPAGRLVPVRHTYKPSVGGTTGITFFFDGKVGGPYLAEYRAKYCLDAGIERAMVNSAKQNDGYPAYWENWISYVLTTGGHWGGSTIEKFTLTIDKGDPQNLLSFCGEGVKKIGPTTFQMVAENFYPARDLDILLLKKFDDRSLPAGTDAGASDRALPTGRQGGRPAPTQMRSPGGDN
jgi:hypothetical protein